MVSPFTTDLRKISRRCAIIPEAEAGPIGIKERRVAVVGIGNELRGDDIAGLLVIREAGKRVESPGILFLEAGPAPENCTGSLRKFRPDWVIFVDAAEMGAPPGEVRWLDPLETTGYSASTHTLPLHVLSDYISSEIGCRVSLLGIQPAHTDFDSPPSQAIRAAVARAAGELIRYLPGQIS